MSVTVLPEGAESVRTGISRTEVIDFIVSLGIDRETALAEVCEVSIVPDVVSVTQFARNDDGHRFVVDDEVATAVTTIAIVDGA